MADKESRLNLRVTAQNDASATLQAINEAMNSVRTSLQELNDAFKTSSSGITSMSDSGRAAASSLEGDAQAFRTVAEAADTMTNALRSDEEVTSAFQSAMERIDQSMMSVETAISSVTMAVRQQTDALTQSNAETAQLTSTVNEGGLLLGLQMVGQSMKDIGETGAHLFENAISSAADFEANISRIHAVLMNREPTANMQEMANMALQMGQNSKFSANEIAEGMYELARQGLSSSQILGNGVNGAIQVVNDLAQATDTNMSDTARVVTDIMHEYNVSGNELRNVANMISGAMHSSSVSMTDLYYSMRQVGPIASSMHQSVDDVSTALAILAQHGITGSAAGTALKNMLLGLEPRTKAAASLMRDLGISAKNGAADSFYTLNGTLKPLPEIIDILNQKFGGLNDSQKQAALATTFTKYGLAGLNTIVTESRDKFEEFKKSLSQEDAASIAHEKMNNLQGDMLRLHAAVQTASKSFGDTLTGAMRGLAQAALSVVNWFNQLSPSIKQTIMIVGGAMSALTILGGTILTVVSAIGFLNMGLGGLRLSFSSVFSAVTGPWGILIAAIITGVALIISHWTQINDWVQQHFGVSIPQILRSVGSVFSSVFGAIGSVVVTVFNGIRSVVESVIGYIAPYIIGAVNRVSSFWQSIWPELAQIFKTIWTGIEVFLGPAAATLYTIISGAIGLIKGIWGPFWSLLGSTLKTDWDFITGVIRLGWDTISGLFKLFLDLLTGNWRKAWQDVKSLVSNIWNDIKSLISTYINDALQWGANFVHMLAAGIEGAASGVVDAVKNIAGKIKSFLGFHSPTEDGPASDSDQWAPNFVKMFAQGLADGAGTVGKAAQTLIQPLSDAFTLGGRSSSDPLAGITNQQDLDKAKIALNAITEAKIQYANASQTNDKAAMDSAHAMAEKYRADLQQMGVDTSNFSDDTTLQDAMENTKLFIAQATTQIAQQYRQMTIDASTQLTQLSDNTDNFSKDFMMQSNSIATASKSMQATMTAAFAAIANSAEQQMTRVVAAVRSAQQAMASMGASGGAIASSTTYNNASSITNQGITNNNIQIHVNGTGSNASNVANSIINVLRQQMSFALR